MKLPTIFPTKKNKNKMKGYFISLYPFDSSACCPLFFSL